MNLQSDLALRLLEIPDVQSKPSGYDKLKLFVCENQEIARIRDDGFVEVKLTSTIISALGLVGSEKQKDWVQMPLSNGKDFPAVIAFVERAVRASKRIHELSDDECAS